MLPTIEMAPEELLDRAQVVGQADGHRAFLVWVINHRAIELKTPLEFFGTEVGDVYREAYLAAFEAARFDWERGVLRLLRKQKASSLASDSCEPRYATWSLIIYIVLLALGAIALVFFLNGCASVQNTWTHN